MSVATNCLNREGLEPKATDMAQRSSPKKVVRDFCGNSFHPGLIDAALGTDEQLQQRVDGMNDAQSCHDVTPPIQETYDKHQQLLRQYWNKGQARSTIEAR